MRSRLVALLLILMACSASAQFNFGGDKNRSQQLRELTGQVVDSHDTPLENAIVYVKNTKSLAVKTFITGKDGKYRFPALAQNVDYDVYAERQGARSAAKTLSAFDSRVQVNINLKIASGK